MALNENTKKWVAALRSGEYKQGRQMLHTVDDEYCCLGVACEVAIKEGVVIAVEMQHGRKMFGGEGGILPNSVRDWLGLVTNDGSFVSEPNGVVADRALTAINDEGNTDFNGIADIIESEPRMLFF